MNTTVQEIAEYFMPQKAHFWQWADDGLVIEWQNGYTICYRNELVDLMRHLEGQRIIPLSSILLFLAACNDNYKEANCKNVLETIAENLAYGGKKDIDSLLNQSIDFMDAVSGLPRDVKNSNPRKAHIIHETLQSQNNHLSNLNWRLLADELNSGRIDISKQTTRITFQADVFKQELGYLSGAGLLYHTTEKLVLKVLTGLPAIPKPLEEVVPEPSSLDLLGQLAQNPKTAGISFLTKHLVAALNIPMHSQGSGQQPIGGISDITNKGSYDRLLLSELAQDEELLTARLVNNEALYFRREEPPDNVNRKRVILLDTTLKMWGLPRVFAISAALASTLNTKHGETIEAFALDGDSYISIDLASQDGIVNCLQQLSPALHCGKSLLALMAERENNHSDEYIFITGDWQHQPYDFHSAFSTVKLSLNFIISVARTGELHLHECIKGNVKLLSTSKFDLGDLLFKGVTKKQHVKKQNFDFQIDFLNQEKSPLYTPTPSSLRLTTDNAMYNYDLGFVAVTADMRLLYWKNKTYGAIEVLGKIELGSSYFGCNVENKIIYILIVPPDNNLYIYYRLNVKTNEVERNEFLGLQKPEKILFEFDKYYIKSNDRVMVFDCESIKISSQNDGNIDFTTYEDTRGKPFYNHERRAINSGYNTMSRFESIKISEQGVLSFDKRELSLTPYPPKFFLKENSNVSDYSNSIEAIPDENFFEIPGKENIRFKKFAWEDGSQIIIDSRGFAHLISGNKTLSQVTIPLIINKSTAGWASDGAISGSEYFVCGEGPVIPTDIFYNKYIQPFIDYIVSCT